MDKDVDRLAQMAKWVLLALVAWWISLGAMIQALVIVQLLDVAGGVLAAGKRGEISSKVFGAGWRRKAYYWLILLLVYTIEGVFAQDFPAVGVPYSETSLTITEVIAAGFIFMEGLSILENGIRVGVPVPKFLITIMAEGRRRFAGAEDKSIKESTPNDPSKA